MAYTEANYENAVVQLIEQLGYTHVYGPDVERDYTDPLYSEVLEGALIAVNPGVPQAAIGKDTAMDKTILIEKTSKHLKRWELIVTAALFLTLIAGFGTLYIAIPLAIAVWGIAGLCFLGFIAVRTAIWWNHG